MNLDLDLVGIGAVIALLVLVAFIGGHISKRRKEEGRR